MKCAAAVNIEACGYVQKCRNKAGVCKCEMSVKKPEASSSEVFREIQ